jgi:hypothetical protein
VSLLDQIPAARATSARNSSAPPRIVGVRRDFSPQHHEILICDRRFIVLVAGRRWGKTNDSIHSFQTFAVLG